VDVDTFLHIIVDVEGCLNFTTHIYKDEEVQIPLAITPLTIKKLFRMAEMADRFDCEDMAEWIEQALDLAYTTETGLHILAAASEINSVPVAKIGIAKMGENGAGQYFDWWNLIKTLRLSWQIELTRLVWEFQCELVNRPEEERKKRRNGKNKPRSREFIMVQTNKPYEQIAAAFNPPLEVSDKPRFG
jgi:hypothetical protein